MLKGTLWSGFYRIAAIGTAFLISVVSARLLGLTSYGTLQFVLSITQLVQLGLGLGLATQVLRKSGEEKVTSNPGELDVLIKRSVAIFLILMFLVGVPGFAFWGLIDGPGQLALLGAAAAFAISQHLIGVYRSALVGRSHFMAAGFGEFLSGIIALALLGGLLVVASTVKLDPADVLLVRTGTATLGSLFLYLSWKNRRTTIGVFTAPIVDGAAMISLARAGFPVMLIGIGAIVNSSADIILLGLIRSSTEVGHYHVATRGASLVVLPLTVMIVPLSPIISKLHRTNQRELKTAFIKTTAVAAVAALVIAGLLLLLLQQFLGLFGPAFQGAANVTIALIAAQLLNACFGPVQHLLVMTGHQNLASRAMLYGVATNVILNLILIPHFGGVGAAVGTGIGIVVWNVLAMLAVQNNVFCGTGSDA
jgi:O-antigen/teichoic acid export membrane protein